jgi:hypothetical protein
MDISNWGLYYKIHETEFLPTTTQMCYEPKVSPDKKTFCMNFCFPCEYQARQHRISYNKEHVDFMFQREIKYLQIFKDRKWAPEILDIVDNKIFIKWYGKTCNDSLYKENNLNPNWYNDLEHIIMDQVDTGFLKCTVYPHSHYYDDNGVMHTLDFYATVERDNPCMSYEKLSGLIGFETNRFELARENDMLNIETLFQSGLLNYSKWPNDLTKIYNKIYGNK